MCGVGEMRTGMGQDSMCRALWTMGRTLIFTLSEVGAKEGSVHRMDRT